MPICDFLNFQEPSQDVDWSFLQQVQPSSRMFTPLNEGQYNNRILNYITQPHHPSKSCYISKPPPSLRPRQNSALVELLCFLIRRAPLCANFNCWSNNTAAGTNIPPYSPFRLESTATARRPFWPRLSLMIPLILWECRRQEMPQRKVSSPM